MREYKRKETLKGPGLEKIDLLNHILEKLFEYLVSPFIAERVLLGWEKTQLVKCLSCKLENLNLVPRTQVKTPNMVVEWGL